MKHKRSKKIKKKIIKNNIKDQKENTQNSVNIYRINFVLLKHLLRSDYISKTICSEEDPDYISVIEVVLSSSLNISSWKHFKNEEISINSILAKFGEIDFTSAQGSKIHEYLIRLCSDQEEYFILKEDEMKIKVKSKDLVTILQVEFLENFISNKLGKESLRVMKAAEVLIGKTEQTLQEFCLIPAKSFKKIVIDLIELNYMCKYIYYFF